jgi:hypothetical protein
MSYKLKTLIVFDTNSLRSTDAGEVAYSFFAFGKPFQIIENFLIENKLTDDIDLAVPSWAIEEIKDQKHRKYNEDIIDFHRLVKRLSGLPHLSEITLPREEFDCASYVEEKAKEYLEAKAIKLIEIKEELAHEVLRSMMSRVMRDEGKKQPFAHSGKYKDAGFKDNIVWESLMNYEDVQNYDKIIFITKDGDYNKNCEAEFRSRWDRHIVIVKDENYGQAEIQKDYGNYIKERGIYDFAQSEYFTDYLNDELKEKSVIVIDNVEYPIDGYGIHYYCKSVDRLLPNEDDNENIVIMTEVLITYSDGRERQACTVEAKTILLDDETKDILSTEYDIEIK